MRHRVGEVLLDDRVELRVAWFPPQGGARLDDDDADMVGHDIVELARDGQLERRSMIYTEYFARGTPRQYEDYSAMGNTQELLVFGAGAFVIPECTIVRNWSGFMNPFPQVASHSALGLAAST